MSPSPPCPFSMRGESDGCSLMPGSQMLKLTLICASHPFFLQEPPVYPSNTNPSTRAVRCLILLINPVLARTSSLSHSIRSFPPASKYAQIFLHETSKQTNKRNYSSSLTLLLELGPIRCVAWTKVFTSSGTPSKQHGSQWHQCRGVQWTFSLFSI